MINRANVEIRDQAHEMLAEGAQNEIPLFSAITEILKQEGFTHGKIQYCFDNLQQIWRWVCSIERIQE